MKYLSLGLTSDSQITLRFLDELCFFPLNFIFKVEKENLENASGL